MAQSADRRAFSNFADDGADVDRERKREAEAALKESARKAADTGSLLLDVFTTLPSAIVAAEKDEYRRVVERYGKDHANAKEVEASLAAFEHLEVRASRGRARIERVIAAQKTPGDALHGFVADEEGAPLAGLRVRLTGRAISDAQEATTQSDGYFAVPLPAKDARAPNASPAQQQEGATATVVVADAGGKTLYEDPVPLDLAQGSAYREYRIERPSGQQDPKSAAR